MATSGFSIGLRGKNQAFGYQKRASLCRNLIVEERLGEKGCRGEERSCRNSTKNCRKFQQRLEYKTRNNCNNLRQNSSKNYTQTLFLLLRYRLIFLVLYSPLLDFPNKFMKYLANILSSLGRSLHEAAIELAR